MLNQIQTKQPASYLVFRLRIHCPRMKQESRSMFRKAAGLLMAIVFAAIFSDQARATPPCLKGSKQPFTLKEDSVTWNMSVVPGSECIQGIRWSYMQIYGLEVLKAPTKGRLVVVGPGFRYFADSASGEADSFTLAVYGKNRHEIGKSTLEVVVKYPLGTLVSELPQQP